MAVQETDGKQTAMRIDMNSDMGESFGRWTLGDDEALLDVVSSANVACGFHAGDPSVMLRTLSYAASRGVMVGAHVAYRDLAGFGRRYVDESPDELKADVMYQIAALEGMARSVGAQVRYVKPHGALYNRIVRDESQAAAVVEAIRSVDASLAILTQPGAGDMRRDSAESRFDTPEHRLRFWCRAPFCGNIEPVRHNRGNGRKDSRKEFRNDFLEPKEAP